MFARGRDAFADGGLVIASFLPRIRPSQASAHKTLISHFTSPKWAMDVATFETFYSNGGYGG